MAFVRRRGNSHQLIETYRDGGKVKQRIVANLGSLPTRRRWWQETAYSSKPPSPSLRAAIVEELITSSPARAR